VQEAVAAFLLDGDVPSDDLRCDQDGTDAAHLLTGNVPAGDGITANVVYPAGDRHRTPSPPGHGPSPVDALIVKFSSAASAASQDTGVVLHLAELDAVEDFFDDPAGTGDGSTAAPHTGGSARSASGPGSATDQGRLRHRPPPVVAARRKRSRHGIRGPTTPGRGPWDWERDAWTELTWWS
jgi:hypothetical protein